MSESCERSSAGATLTRSQPMESSYAGEGDDGGDAGESVVCWSIPISAAAAVLYAFERKRNAFSHRQRGRETLMFGGNERIDRRAGWRLEKQVFEICEVARLDKDHWRARRKAIEVSLCKLVSP